MTKVADTLCVVLAGGEGRRIGGDKPGRRLGDRTLLDHALSRARTYASHVQVAMREPSPLGPRPGEVYDDARLAGPLAGLHAGLRSAVTLDADYLLTIPCDMPWLPPDLSLRLRRELEAQPQTQVAPAVCAGRLHPTCALWRPSILSALDGYADAGGRSLKGLIGLVSGSQVAWTDAEAYAFANINSPEDLALAEAGRRFEAAH